MHQTHANYYGFFRSNENLFTVTLHVELNSSWTTICLEEYFRLLCESKYLLSLETIRLDCIRVKERITVLIVEIQLVMVPIYIPSIPYKFNRVGQEDWICKITQTYSSSALNYGNTYNNFFIFFLKKASNLIIWTPICSLYWMSPTTKTTPSHNKKKVILSLKSSEHNKKQDDIPVIPVT